ncbi:MAG: metallophosphoesterase, partial [Luteolibacter sp.]
MNRRSFITLSLAATAVARAAESAPKPVLSFGLITDVQYTDAEPNGERHYRESPGKLKAAVDLLSKKNLPFTLHLGDFIDRDFTAFDTVLPLLDALGHPVHHLLGNHDYSVTDGEKGRVVAKLGMPHDYYTLEKPGVRIVMIDTNDRSVYKYPKDSTQTKDAEVYLQQLAGQQANNAKTWNGGVAETQLAWLDHELAAAAAAKVPVILCGHHPLIPADGMQAWDCESLLALIDKHPWVLAYFCGHQHAGAEVMRNGVPYITFKSVLHEPGINAYSVIHLFKNKLEIEGYGRELSRVIPLR